MSLYMSYTRNGLTTTAYKYMVARFAKNGSIEMLKLLMSYLDDYKEPGMYVCSGVVTHDVFIIMTSAGYPTCTCRVFLK